MKMRMKIICLATAMSAILAAWAACAETQADREEPRARAAPTVLEMHAKRSDWGKVRQACIELDRIDPQGHMLSEDQRKFLDISAITGKAGTTAEQINAMAALDRTEVRPFVMWMLETNRYMDAIAILVIWKDTGEAGKILRMAQEESGAQKAVLAGAYMVLDGSDKSFQESLDMLREMLVGDGFYEFAKYSLEAVLRSDLPAQRKLAAARAYKSALAGKSTAVVAECMWALSGDIAGVLVPMMQEETDLATLAYYARVAAEKDPVLFSPEVRRSLLLLAETGESKGLYNWVPRYILDAAIACRLEGCGDVAGTFMSWPDPFVRAQGANAAIRLGGDRARALSLLHEELSNPDANIRDAVAGFLKKTPCADESERASREAAVLALLGRTEEDYVLGVLVTCQGAESARLLSEIIDEDDVPRAVTAAWVLAQSEDEAVRDRGLRRLAIFAFFNHNDNRQSHRAEISYIGESIDFRVPPVVEFRQTMKPWQRGPVGVVRIPDELLVPFALDEPEQKFAVRAWRHMLPINPMYPDLDREAGGPLHPVRCFTSLAHGGAGDAVGTSWLPLLSSMAREDTDLAVVEADTGRAAFFPGRKAAAEIIARITGAPAAYVALAGEELDSSAVPTKPYERQTALVASFLIDLIEHSRLADMEACEKRRLSVWRYSHTLTCLTSKEAFGDDLRGALLAEALARNETAKFKDAGFFPWEDMEYGKLISSRVQPLENQRHEHEIK